MRIACLHSADGNIPVYEEAQRPAGMVLEHIVRRDLLDAAEAAGGLNEEVRQATVATLHDATADAAHRRGAGTIVFAQSSMAPAALHCRVAKPLTSPAVGLHAVARAMGGSDLDDAWS